MTLNNQGWFGPDTGLLYHRIDSKDILCPLERNFWAYSLKDIWFLPVCFKFEHQKKYHTSRTCENSIPYNIEDTVNTPI